MFTKKYLNDSADVQGSQDFVNPIIIGNYLLFCNNKFIIFTNETIKYIYI